MHALFLGARANKLHEHPIISPDEAPRVLDLGCGTGMWCLDMASHLKPRTGRFEQVEVDLEPRCDDGTLPEDATINRWYDALKSATQIAGRPIAYNTATPQMLAAQGFTDIQEKVIRLPLSYWRGSGGPQREIAYFYPLALVDEAGLEAYSLGPLTRAPVSWPVEDVMRYCEETKRDIQNKNYHVYHVM
ncbi:MAG: hypothetical protein Q9183_000547 [Haloplaca sp. 2 TL-2023]